MRIVSLLSMLLCVGYIIESIITYHDSILTVWDTAGLTFLLRSIGSLRYSYLGMVHTSIIYLMFFCK